MNTVIYHSADFDGIFCREIARKFMPDATLIGWDFGDKPLAIPTEGTIYVMDLPVDRVFDIKFDRFHPFLQRTIWIDHHKSSIETHPETVPGYRIDGVAACRLVWQWFAVAQHNAQHQTNEALQVPLPSEEHFIDRVVPEPWAVRLAGEYDVWDKRDPDAELFQHGLRSQQISEKQWGWLLGNNKYFTSNLLDQGTVLQYAKTQENAAIIAKNGFDVQWEGLTFLACNASHYNSHLFTAGIKPHHDALLGFCRRANGTWSISLYGVPGKDIDLSQIARRNGGGGHRGACGFTSETIPLFLL